MAEAKFYRCNRCGLMIAVVKDGPCTPVCCGEKMELLDAGSVDAAREKHVPELTVEGDELVVRVGSVEHPMLDVHYIEWIAYVSPKKTVIKYLKPGEKPEATFHIDGDDVTVYAYCNLHGLWKADL